MTGTGSPGWPLRPIFRAAFYPDNGIATPTPETVGTVQKAARVLAETSYGGCVAACGLAGGADLPTTVMPFILRNVSLRGVDSVMCPVDRRKEAWSRLVRDLPAGALGEIGHTVSLEELPEMAEKIVAGQVRGRVIVDVNR